ncbi:MAG: isochorismatase family protein [Rhodospirillales bacterium]
MSDSTSAGREMDLLRRWLPVAVAPFDSAAFRSGLVVVDVINGFATVGGGALAPRTANAQVARMVDETDRLARAFAAKNLPIFVFLDTHEPGKPEPPYPSHCERGSGEDELVPQLAWLADCPQATLLRKDCINGFVGATDLATGDNRMVRWINDHGLQAIVVVGICTDICVMDLVLTTLSARNHGMTPTLSHIVVYEPGCATYDLPRDTALSLGLPETAAHPQQPTHHVGLYLMASRGARLASAIT